MVSFSFPLFLGMFPRKGPRLLGDAEAAYARDARSISGYLEGREGDVLLATLPGTPAKVRRVKDTDGRTGFLTFITPNVDVVRAPSVNDRFSRYFWAGENIPPSFNTAARIIDGQPGYFLGVARPVAQPTVTPQGTAGTLLEERFYLYTHVDEFFQESAPSDPAGPVTIAEGQSVRVGFVTPDPPGPNTPRITKFRVYRTVPTLQGTSAFFFVAEVDSTETFYIDTMGSDRVALNETLQTASWTPPPTDLKGLALHPSGFLVGFRGRDVLFSDPYQPHAWPVNYIQSVEDEIVGLAVFDTNIAILTVGTPYLATGVLPESITLLQTGPTNSCVARRSIVALPGAVLYASDDGLVALTVSGHTLVTREIMDRETWRRDYTPRNIVAARDGDARYIAFFEPDLGFEMDFKEPGRGITYLTPPGPVDGVDEDDDGRRALMSTGGEVYTLEALGAPPLPYKWRSKEVYLPRPLNLGAMEVLGGTTLTSTIFSTAPVARVRVFADKRTVFDEEVTLNESFKLPSGFKAQTYQFEIEGRMPVARVAVAQHSWELANE
jgi:hypothetical protein